MSRKTMSPVSPRRIEVEASVLGMCMRDTEALDMAHSSGVLAETFFFDKHQSLWRALLLAEKAGGVDPITVGLQATGMPWIENGAIEALDVYEKAPIAQNAQFFIDELKFLAWRDQAMNELSVLLDVVYQADAGSDGARVRMRIASALAELDTGGEAHGLTPIADVVNPVLDTIERRVIAHRQGVVIQGVTTGIPKLDGYLAGWCPGRLYIVAARPGRGKTTFLVNAIDAAELVNEPWLMTTCEMNNADIAEKVMSKRGKVPYVLMQSGALSDDELDTLMASARDMHGMVGAIDDQAGWSLETFESAVRRAKRRYNIRVAFCDYLQQMEVRTQKFRDRQSEIAFITKRLKKLSGDQGVALVVACQLNREAEDEVPNMSHLRESGAIEQDADAIMFLHQGMGEPLRIMLAKNRRGPTGQVICEAKLGINSITQSEINQDD